MADFFSALKKIILMEGGYIDDPEDAGGETYKGISRVYNPSWSGWEKIDRIKERYGGGDCLIPTLMATDTELLQDVSSFYKTLYWDRFQGDRIPLQEVAEELFDISVQMGIHKAVLFLQESLNLLNRNQTTCPDIVEDGILGPKTLKALQTYLQKDHAGYLLKLLNLLQGIHYMKYMKKVPAQEKYARGWLKRIKI